MCQILKTGCPEIIFIQDVNKKRLYEKSKF